MLHITIFQIQIHTYMWFFEQETGYMVSNCAKLQWELTIARGVSDFDIEHRTIRFLEYQASISHLNLKEY